MKLYYWQGFDNITNFGDELNKYIWDRLLPNLFDGNGQSIFVGIGTLLNERVPQSPQTIVMGAGAGYGLLPKIDRSWTFYAVCGPYTAELLGLSPDIAITDPAILVRRLYATSQPEKTYKYGFMPHWANAHSGWAEACEAAGIKYISPLRGVEEVLNDLRKTELLLTEAMHGAIVADALRVPWIPLHTQFFDYHPQKWQDWCRTVEISYDSTEITRLFDFDAMDRLAISKPIQFGKGILKTLYSPYQKSRVVNQLREVSSNAPSFLSKESVSQRLLARMEEAIELFKTDLATGTYGEAHPEAHSALQRKSQPVKTLERS